MCRPFKTYQSVSSVLSNMMQRDAGKVNSVVDITGFNAVFNSGEIIGFNAVF